MGRKLEAFLLRTYKAEEIEKLPIPAQNLIKFHQNMSNADIVRFTQYMDNTHEIVFKEYNYDQTRFKAIFEALGELYDVQMQAGANNYISLSKEFDIRRKVEAVFKKFKKKIVFAKKPTGKAREEESKYTKISEDDSWYA